MKNQPELARCLQRFIGVSPTEQVVYIKYYLDNGYPMRSGPSHYYFDRTNGYWRFSSDQRKVFA